MFAFGGFLGDDLAAQPLALLTRGEGGVVRFRIVSPILDHLSQLLTRVADGVLRGLLIVALSFPRLGQSFNVLTFGGLVYACAFDRARTELNFHFWDRQSHLWKLLFLSSSQPH